MAGKLVQVATETVTSAVASVTLTGIDSDDVYMCAISNVGGSVDNQAVRSRFTVSGTADSSANYDRAQKVLRSNTTFSNSSGTGNPATYNFTSSGTGTQEVANAIYFMYNFNNASEYSFCTWEIVERDSSGNCNGSQGGGVLTVAQACDGIQFFMNSGNIASGTFTLYKVV